jgi:superfamily I DNA and/or RNA helicase
MYPAKKFEIATIDSFQGRESDIIIFSAVRSNTKYFNFFIKKTTEYY